MGGAAEAISHASRGSVTALPAPCPLGGRSHTLLWDQDVSGRQVGSRESEGRAAALRPPWVLAVPLFWGAALRVHRRP